MIDQILATALTCMAQTAYMESRSEDILAQVSVIQVLWRRANHNPRNVCVEMKKPYQFSWYAKIEPPSPWSVELRPYYLLANQVIKSQLPDYSKGATNFHDTSIHKPVTWKVAFVAQYSHLIFYRQEETKYAQRF